MTDSAESIDAAEGNSKAHDSITSELELSPELLLALRKFRQGDVLPTLKELIVIDAEGRPSSYTLGNGAVVISQTCDLVLPTRPSAQISPLVYLQDPDAEMARDGKRPRYVHVTALGPYAFVDLEFVGTLDKRHLATLERTGGLLTEMDVSRFGREVGRRYGRFPFPDEVTPWLRPLEEVVASKYQKNSAEGRAFHDVMELRVESTNGWLGPAYTLNLVVIVEPGTLPLFANDELPEIPSDLAEWLYENDGKLRRNSNDIATRLNSAVSPIDRYWLWAALGDSWAARCKPRGRHRVDDTISNAVREVTCEVISGDEFPLTRYRKSERLDLDHLSEPPPY